MTVRRILHVAPGYPPRQLGGLEHNVRQTAREQVEAGLECAVVCPEFAAGGDPAAAGTVERSDDAGVTVHRVTHPAAEGAWNEFRCEPIERAFDGVLADLGPDIVHVHGLISTSLVLPALARSAGAAVVHTLHDYHAFCANGCHLRHDLTQCDVVGDAAACARCEAARMVLLRRRTPDRLTPGVPDDELEDDERRELRQALYEPTAGLPAERFHLLRAKRAAILRASMRNLQAAGAVICPSRALHAAFERLPFAGDPPRFHDVPCGIEPATPVSVRRAADEPLRVVATCRVEPDKGVHVLARAAAEADRRSREAGGAGVHVTVRGPTTSPAFAERVRADLGDAGDMPGPFVEEELAAVLADAHVVAVPSQWRENCPYSVREPPAAGVPVIASALGGIPEFVEDGVNALLVEPAGSVEAWTDALLRLEREDGLLARLASGCRATRPPDVAEIGARIREIYGQAQEAAAGPSPADYLVEADLGLAGSVDLLLRAIGELDRGAEAAADLGRAVAEVDARAADSAQAVREALASLDRATRDLDHGLSERVRHGRSLEERAGASERRMDLHEDELERLRADLDRAHRRIEAMEGWRETRVEYAVLGFLRGCKRLAGRVVRRLLGRGR